jgi:hypothetical protein
LAETFTDPQRHAGTAYKAAGWLPVGESAAGDHRCDFFPGIKGAKRLWLKPLHPQARERLCAPELPGPCQAALNHQPTPRCVLTVRHCQSLFQALSQVPDPRHRQGRRYHIGGVLSIVALALLRGAVHLTTLHRTGQKLDQNQRARLRLPLKGGTRFRQVPGYFVYRDLLRTLDLDAFASALTNWLQAHAGQLPRTLAMDGKVIREKLGLIVTLVDAGEGTPVAVMANVLGKGHELKTAQKLLASQPVNLHNATVTTDSLHCQDQTAQQVVLEKGGDYLFQIRDNQPILHALAQNKMKESTPLLPRARAATDAMSCAR